MSTKSKASTQESEITEEVISNSIQCHPQFMLNHYSLKLRSSENLTQTPEIVQSRIEWAKNKELAERVLGGKGK